MCFWDVALFGKAKKRMDCIACCLEVESEIPLVTADPAMPCANKLLSALLIHDGSVQDGPSWFQDVLVRIMNLNARRDKQLVVLTVASTRYAAMDLKGTSSRYAKCGLVPMIPPSAGDLLLILQDLLQRACPSGAAMKKVNGYAEELMCELCAGNYRVFGEALLAFCDVRQADTYAINPGESCVSDKRAGP